MQHEDIFNQNFLKEFTGMADDKVKNVRIQMAKVIGYHYRDGGLCIQNNEMHEAILKLKNDCDRDVRSLISPVPLPEDF